jgi:long-chain-fatty-acid--[acyl-carrier-protein] ligase
MRRLVEFFLVCFFRTILWFRYRISFKGLENLNKKNLNRQGGVLFLPNHPCVFVDPVTVTLGAWKRYPIRPMVVEYFHKYPIVQQLLDYLRALPVPDFGTSSNSLKRKKTEEVFQTMIQGLKAGENFLLYPAGSTKNTAKEVLGGASGLHRVLSDVPEANIVLVRVKGLWGSRFSRYWTGKAPPLFPVLKWGIKKVFQNLLLFTPRRKVVIEFVPAPEDFPRGGSRLEINRYLENWYNQPDGFSPQEGEHPGDSLILRPYLFYSKEMPVREVSAEQEEDKLDEARLPDEVRHKVLAKLSELSEIPVDKINYDMTIASDIGLDSLDTAEVAAFLHDMFEIPGVPVSELTTVKKVLAIASGQYKVKVEPEEIAQDLTRWLKPVKKERVYLGPGKTIGEVFLNVANKFPDKMTVLDDRTGAMDYKTLKLRAIILASKIKEMPGDSIGILLPASVGALLCILACELAGKTPVMVNWTVGPRHLETVKELSKIQKTLSSWAFIDKLEGVDLNGLEDQIVMLEDLRREIGLLDKLKGLWLSKQKPEKILSTLNPKGTSPDDPAVILFTSGSEAAPKGVPLSHKNILSNQKPIFEEVPLYTDDTILAILPPFHSFGFTIASLVGVLSGLRVAFYPKPTEGRKLAERFHRWKLTVMCGAPSFLKGMLKAAEEHELETMRLCVTGAEKAPPELFKRVKDFANAEILEGYGITECSPVLTLNRPGIKRKEVGQALPGVEILVVHPETFEPVPRNTQGHILASGDTIFSGYLNPGLEPPFVTIGGKRWYKTGDLGMLDEEGFLTITGRQKRFIKVGGEMISLSAVEEGLLKKGLEKGWPISEETASLGVIAREQQGEKPKIILFTTFDLDVDAANQAVKEAGFSNIVRISQVVKIDEIPIMGTGKVNFRALEKMNT